MMPIELKAPLSATPKKEWTVTGRFVLICFIAFFAVIIGVNAIMMTLAIRTFPGADARNGYEVSQNYNREIAAARLQTARGWSSDTVLARAGDAARLTVAYRSATGAAVSGLEVEARLKHPTDRKQDHVVALREFAPGVYQADENGLADGFWGVSVVARQNGERMHQAETRLLLQR